MEKNFCYWQEDPPVSIPMYNNKICLLKENEYRLLKESSEAGLIKNISIFCPYNNAEQALECEQYWLIKDMKWDKS